METLNASDKFKKNLDKNADLDEIEEVIQRYESDEFKQNNEKAKEVSKGHYILKLALIRRSRQSSGKKKFK